EPDELRQPKRTYPRELPLGQASERQQGTRRGQPKISDEADLNGRCSDPAVVGREGLGPQPRNPGEHLVPASKKAHVAAGRTWVPMWKRSRDRVRAAGEVKDQGLDPVLDEIVEHRLNIADQTGVDGGLIDAKSQNSFAIALVDPGQHARPWPNSRSAVSICAP